MTRWFVVGAMIVLPVVVHAECGWLLMVPPAMPSAPWGTPVTDAWQREYEAQVDANIHTPMSKWKQQKAFDSAQACETDLGRIRSGFARPRGPVDNANTAKLMAIVDNALMTRWEYARCLPASQVPMR